MSLIHVTQKRNTGYLLNFFSIVFIASSFISCSNELYPQIPKPNGTITHHTLHSDIVGDDYDIIVRLPPDYDKESGSYTVLFQLDAESQFDITAGIINDLEQKEVCSPTIVIGIGYPYPSGGANPKGRNRDYTLPMEYPEFAYGAEGGAVNFYRFIRSELIPYLNSNYSIAGPEHRAIIGHSYGGLFVLYSFFQYDSASPCISSFLAASPSLWFDGGSIYKCFDSLKTRCNHVPLTLYLSVGDIEGTYMNCYFDDMSSRIKDTFTGVQVKSTKFNTEHIGNILPSYAEGIRFLVEHGL